MKLSTDLLKTLALKQHLGQPYFIVESNIGETIALEGDENKVREQYLLVFPEGSEENEDYETFESWAIENCISIEPYENENYLVLDDYEADEAWDKELDYYIDECILCELPEQYRNYFNSEAWKNDARQDGRGHCLASYDGKENEETVNGETFYIYRIN